MPAAATVSSAGSAASASTPASPSSSPMREPLPASQRAIVPPRVPVMSRCPSGLKAAALTVSSELAGRSTETCDPPAARAPQAGLRAPERDDAVASRAEDRPSDLPDLVDRQRTDQGAVAPDHDSGGVAMQRESHMAGGVERGGASGGRKLHAVRRLAAREHEALARAVACEQIERIAARTHADACPFPRKVHDRVVLEADQAEPAVRADARHDPAGDRYGRGPERPRRDDRRHRPAAGADHVHSTVGARRHRVVRASERERHDGAATRDGDRLGSARLPAPHAPVGAPGHDLAIGVSEGGERDGACRAQRRELP